MRRRTVIVAGASVVSSLASSALRFTRATASASGSTPWTGPTAAPTPALSPDQVSPPGGLGNTRRDVEKIFGPPTGLQGTMIAYQNGTRAATFDRDRAAAILISFGGARGATFDQARTAIATVLPLDRTAIGTIGAGPNRVAELYQSARLASKLAPPTAKVQPGQFVVVYESNLSGGIGSALAIVGDIPKA